MRTRSFPLPTVATMITSCPRLQPCRFCLHRLPPHTITTTASDFVVTALSIPSSPLHFTLVTDIVSTTAPAYNPLARCEEDNQ